jgi:hypothetical protein
MSSIELRAGEDMVEGGVRDPREFVDVDSVDDFLLGLLNGKAEGEWREDALDRGESCTGWLAFVSAPGPERGGMLVWILSASLRALCDDGCVIAFCLPKELFSLEANPWWPSAGKRSSSSGVCSWIGECDKWSIVR